MRRYKLDPGKTSIYFCTCTIVQWQCIFKDERYCRIIIDSLNYCRKNKGLLLYGLVIMLNHIHWISSSRENILLSDIMRDFKRHTAKEIARMLKEDDEKLLLYIFKNAGIKQNSSMKVWQDEYHPEAIYSEKWFNQKMNYLHDNPVRKGFVIQPEDWKYSSARNWFLDDHSIISLDLDDL